MSGGTAGTGTGTGGGGLFTDGFWKHNIQSVSESGDDEESKLLQDVLYGFNGIESDCFRLDPSCTAFHYFRRGSLASDSCLCCAVDEMSSSTDSAAPRLRAGLTTLDNVIMERVLGTINSAWRVSRFCEAEIGSHSLVVMSFASVMRTDIVEHVSLFAAKLHSLLLKKQLSLSKLLLHADLHVCKLLTIACMLLEVFNEQKSKRSELVAAAGENIVAAVALLDTLYSKKVINFVDAVHDEQAAAFFDHVRREVTQTYVKSVVVPWMTRGTLTNDVFQEFFVRYHATEEEDAAADDVNAASSMTDVSSSEAVSVAANSSKETFEMCGPKLVPKFLRRQGLEAGVFESGLYVNLSNRGRPVSRFITVDLSKPLPEMVAQCTALSNRLLLDTICSGDANNFVSTLRHLCYDHFFLGSQRDALSRFMHHFGEELCRQVSKLHQTQEQENRLFREFLKPWIGDECAIECNLNVPPESSEGAMLAELVHATVRVPKTYQVVVTEESIQTYQTLSSALFLLSFVKEQFIDSAYISFTLDTSSFIRSEHAKGFYLVLFDMQTFIAKFKQFFYDDVMTPDFNALVAKATSMIAGGVIGIKALQEMHSAFIQRCATGSTLGDPKCREFLVLILRTVMEYCQLLQSLLKDFMSSLMTDGEERSSMREDSTALFDEVLAGSIRARDELRKQFVMLLDGWIQHAAVQISDRDPRFVASFGGH